jgi:hypothetical protein
MTTQDFSLPPRQGFVLTHFLTVADLERSAEPHLNFSGRRGPIAAKRTAD